MINGSGGDCGGGGVYLTMYSVVDGVGSSGGGCGGDCGSCGGGGNDVTNDHLCSVANVTKSYSYHR